MQLIITTKEGDCKPTRYGKILNKLYKPIFFIAHTFPKLYKFIYKHILKKNHNYLILIASQHIIDKDYIKRLNKN